MMNKQLFRWIAPVALASLILALAIDPGMASDSRLNKFMPDSKTKNNFKVFLTNMKVRHVPLAKETGENYLARLYKRERHLKDDIEGLKRNLVLEDNSKFAESNVELIESSIEDKKQELREVQNKIEETIRVIKDPKNSIMVPSGYAYNPEEQREIEKEQLIRDRENSNYRSNVLEGKIKPSWLVDEW